VLLESDRALREVEDGGDYNGLKVYFAPDTEQLVAKALKLCRGGGVLVSSGVTMESRATEAGITVVGSSTFRKAFLQGGLPGGGDRGDRSDRGGNGGEEPSGASAPEGSSEGGEDNSAVRNLIDLVE